MIWLQVLPPSFYMLNYFITRIFFLFTVVDYTLMDYFGTLLMSVASVTESYFEKHNDAHWFFFSINLFFIFLNALIIVKLQIQLNSSFAVFSVSTWAETSSLFPNSVSAVAKEKVDCAVWSKGLLLLFVAGTLCLVHHTLVVASFSVVSLIL